MFHSIHRGSTRTSDSEYSPPRKHRSHQLSFVFQESAKRWLKAQCDVDGGSSRATPHCVLQAPFLREVSRGNQLRDASLNQSPCFVTTESSQASLSNAPNNPAYIQAVHEFVARDEVETADTNCRQNNREVVQLQSNYNLSTQPPRQRLLSLRSFLHLYHPLAPFVEPSLAVLGGLMHPALPQTTYGLKERRS